VSKCKRKPRATHYSNSNQFDTETFQPRNRKEASLAAKKPNVVNFNTYVREKRKVDITPKTQNQAEYVGYLRDWEKSAVFALGPAGSGKTLLAVLAGIQALKDGDVKKIIIARPAVEVEGEKHGFLPGTLTEKLAPWAIPVMDVFKEYYSVPEIAGLLEEEIVELASLGMMRGRTFKDAWIILDEAQNVSPTQLLMFLTRIGDNSKMVITGDLKQTDRSFQKDNSGLLDFFKRFDGHKSDAIVKVEFDKGDIQRHPLVTEILTLYEKD